jgi:hypothetical protein
MKKKISLLLLVLASLSSQAQDTVKMRLYEDTLQKFAYTVLNGANQDQRIKASYTLIPILVNALKQENSFKYHFDSLTSVSILYPPDKAFRIFTWFFRGDNGAYRYFGAIQMNKKELELYPLYDYSDSVKRPADTVLTNESWFGALYYNIQPVKAKGGQTYYMLFGWDGNDLLSSKKLIDVLYFDKDKPKFGAPLFEFTGDRAKEKPVRFILEYRRDAGITLNYSAEQKKIVFSHLVAPSESAADGKFTFLPDGSYDGFQWKGGKWKFIDNVYSDIIDSRKNVPLPAPKGSDHMMKDK